MESAGVSRVSQLVIFDQRIINRSFSPCVLLWATYLWSVFGRTSNKSVDPAAFVSESSESSGPVPPNLVVLFGAMWVFKTSWQSKCCQWRHFYVQIPPNHSRIKSYGIGRSNGTKVLKVSANIKEPGNEFGYNLPSQMWHSVNKR